MRKIKILPEEFTVKVISIDKEELLEGTFSQLNGYHEYQDKTLQEHLYSVNVKEIIEQKTYLNAKVSQQLDDIKELCDKHSASYFRILDL